MTLKSATGAPRSPVNNCGEVRREPAPDIQVATPEYVTAVMDLIESGYVSWNDDDVAKMIRDSLKHNLLRRNQRQRYESSLKPSELAPSARLTKVERERMPKIRFDLAQNGIVVNRWELEVLSRGATVICEGRKFSYLNNNDFCDAGNLLNKWTVSSKKTHS